MSPTENRSAAARALEIGLFMLILKPLGYTMAGQRTSPGKHWSVQHLDILFSAKGLFLRVTGEDEDGKESIGNPRCLSGYSPKP
jgi:hypothetical protein